MPNNLNSPFKNDPDNLSLVVARDDRGRVLLGIKTRGFGAGMLVLPGGKNLYRTGPCGVGLVPGRECASEELAQETGLTLPPEAFIHKASIFVTSQDGSKNIDVFEVVCRGMVPNPSDELIRPAWYAPDAIAYDKTPADYKLWLPQVLAGLAVNAFFSIQDGRGSGAVFSRTIEPPGLPEKTSVTFDT